MLIWWLHVTCKWFLAWPLCDLINFLRIKCKKNAEKPFACHMWSAKGFSACLWFDQIFNSVFSNVQKVLKIFKTYGFAIWEWLFGMGTIFEKLLHKHSCICQNVKLSNLKNDYFFSLSTIRLRLKIACTACAWSVDQIIQKNHQLWDSLHALIWIASTQMEL